jgi:hypothetical protein
VRVPGCTCNHCLPEVTPDHMVLFVTTTMNVLEGRLNGYWREQREVRKIKPQKPVEDDAQLALGDMPAGEKREEVTELGPPVWVDPQANIGALLIPQIPAMWTDAAKRLVASGMPWACDNGGFTEFKPAPFLRMLEAVAPLPHCHFVACPDVYNDAPATLELFHEWGPKVKQFGLPVALVCQVGMNELEIPWDSLDAIFIGGADNVDGKGWHRGEHVEELIHEAARRGLWVHVGRVSTWSKIGWCRSVGDVHSYDGSAHGRFPDLMLDKGLELGRAPHAAVRLEFTTEGDTGG